MSPLRKIYEYLALVTLLVSLVGLVYTPHDPLEQAFRDSTFAGPSFKHWLGVDGVGRDLASRLWRGAGNTVAMGLSAVLLNLLLATGLLALENCGLRPLRKAVPAVVSVWVAVPVILIGLVLLVFLRPSAPTLVFAAAIGTVPLAYRQLRILWLEQRNALYVQASEVLGAGRWHMLAYTLWPNLRPDLLGLSKLVFALCVLELSGLAFLGLIGDPDFPELGAILRQNHQSFLFRDPWLVIWPGIILSGLLLLVHISRSSSSNT